MKELEAANTGEPLTQLFFNLGRLLGQEMETLRSRGDTAGLERMRTTYQRFLEALVAGQSGQTYESLQWAGESMLELGQASQALAVFERVLKEYAGDDRIPRTKLRRAQALRQAREFEKAWAEVDLLLQKNPKSLDFLMERCQILEDWASVERGRWKTAIDYWKQLATTLGRGKTKSAEYYEAWYHVAHCQFRAGQKDEARRTLKSIMALSKTLGSSETKQKYELLLKQAGG
jgi:tetratricopeptide (TPR) repeat protein